MLVTHNGVPVTDSQRLEADGEFDARLIEGYDIEAILRAYGPSIGDLLDPHDATGSAVYEKVRFGFSEHGDLDVERVALGLDGVVELVDGTVSSTINEHSLIEGGSTVVVGLSGGVDSSALLIALAEEQRRRADFGIIAVTFADYDSTRSPAFEHASHLAAELGLKHIVVPQEVAQRTFNLRLPFSGALLTLMETDDAHQVMYVDHHITRRVLEVVASEHDARVVALGLHVTDLLAGLLNGLAVGYAVGPIPKRSLPNATYIYPLAFVPKRELHLYYFAKTGRWARHTTPNQWEIKPKDRNYYYYVADWLQVVWPGLEFWLFSAHNRMRAEIGPHHQYAQCSNCFGAVQTLGLPWEAGALCDVCRLLERHELLGSPRSATTQTSSQGR